MAKANLKAVPAAQPARNDNPLVDSSVNQSLDNMHAYAEFLCDYLARDDEEPGDRLQHGRYLAMRVLADALAKVGQPEGGAA